MAQIIEYVAQADAQNTLRRRRQIEHILALAQHLDEADRLLIEQVFGQGMPVAKLARLAGKPARRLQRRVQVLVQHMNQPIFTFIVSHRDLLPRPARASAEMVLLRRRSLRAAARSTGLSLHRVRQHVRTVQAMASYGLALPDNLWASRHADQHAPSLDLLPMRSRLPR